MPDGRSTADRITSATLNSLRLTVRTLADCGWHGLGTRMRLLRIRRCNPIPLWWMECSTQPRRRCASSRSMPARGGRFGGSIRADGDTVQRRFRHRGVTVYKDRVFVTYRNFLWAIDRKTGQPIQKFGDDGHIDLRKGLDRPFETLSVSASSPGVIFEDMIILGTSVPETLPGAPGDIRAYDVNTGRMRWTFHTIPHPGEVRLRNVAAGRLEGERRRECVGGLERRSETRHGVRGDGLGVVRFLRRQSPRRQPVRRLRACAGRPNRKAGVAFSGRQARSVGSRFSGGAQPGHRDARTERKWMPWRRSPRPASSSCSTGRPASRCFRSSIVRFRHRRWTASRPRRRSLSAEAASFYAAGVYRRHGDEPDSRGPRGRARLAGQTRFEGHVHASQRARHGADAGYGWRRRVGRRGVRSGDRVALCELERAAMDYPHGDARHNLSLQQ